MQTVLKISLLFWFLVFVLPSSMLTLFSVFAVSMRLSRTQIKLTANPNRRVSLTCAPSALDCCSSIIETKGTKGRCGGAWAQLCSAFCLTGGSLPEEAERDGGEGRVEGSPPLLPSCLWGTGLLRALSNLTRVCFWEEKNKKWRQKVTAGGDKQLLYTVVCFFSKKMPWCSTIPRQDNVLIFV